jgi:hypothetical protein
MKQAHAEIVLQTRDAAAKLRFLAAAAKLMNCLRFFIDYSR